MPLSAVTVVGAWLIHINAVGVIQALLSVCRNACGASATDIARVVIGADGRSRIGVTHDGTATVCTTGLTRQSRTRIEFVATATNIGFIKEALERAFG